MSKKTYFFLAIVFSIQTIVQGIGFYENNSLKKATLFVLSLLAFIFFFVFARKKERK
ncbi:hypothetical protein [Anoxybacillus sp. J5B_2022]|uniref:hypothetical protein n=1 Tax=Anoxybacillus sp. J5B_2022 TaxID=3003246 RepID=UPI00228543E1|nr:hypothetical protein [Anoxybacillus sp. J5B_2022]MCZ0754553.1 hypothetical protein [Anoxybacillus sp. J5B_2022]